MPIFELFSVWYLVIRTIYTSAKTIFELTSAVLVELIAFEETSSYQQHFPAVPGDWDQRKP